MRKTRALAVLAAALSAAVLVGCGPRSGMSTLSAGADSETAEIFSLTKVLDMGTNYLVSLDYENAILQYIDIIQHDPQNKEAYAGLYAAYAAQGRTEDADQVLGTVQEIFAEDEAFLPVFLESAGLVFENGGGSDPFRMLSEHYWEEPGRVYARDVGSAWMQAEPGNADPYALLGAYYAAQQDEEGISGLLQEAQENGIDLDTINTRVETNSDGTCTLTLEIESFLQGEDADLQVTLEPGDDARTVTQKVAAEAADQAASRVVEESGLTGEAARIAESMAQEALRKGLGGAGVPSSSTAAPAPEAPVPEASAPAEEFDWSEIESQFPSMEGEWMP